MSLSLGRCCPTARQEGEAEHLGTLRLAETGAADALQLGSFLEAAQELGWIRPVGPAITGAVCREALGPVENAILCLLPSFLAAWKFETALGAHPSGSALSWTMMMKALSTVWEAPGHSRYIQSVDPEKCNKGVWP